LLFLTLSLILVKYKYKDFFKGIYMEYYEQEIEKNRLEKENRDKKFELERKKSERKESLVMAMKTGATIMAVVLALGAVTSVFNSQTISEGNFGVEQYFDGTYNTETLNNGIKLNVFDKIFEIYGKESLVKIEDVTPKDSDGVMLKDLDLNVGIKVNKNNAVPFLIKTGDIVYNREIGVFVLGQSYIIKEARSSVSQTVRKFKSEELIDKQQEVEDTIKGDLQAQLDKLYGKDTFTVTDIKIANVKLSEAIEQKIQAVEEIKAEEARSNATERILDLRNKVLSKEIAGYQKVAKDNDINFNQVMEFQRTKAMEQGKVSATIQVPISSQSSPKPK